MSLSVKRILLKPLKISSITIVSLLLLLFALPYLFPQTVSNKIKQWAKSSAPMPGWNGEVDYFFYKNRPYVFFRAGLIVLADLINPLICFRSSSETFPNTRLGSARIMPDKKSLFKACRLEQSTWEL